MNILVVTGTFPSVSQAFITNKVVGLAGRGHRVTVVSLACRPAANPPSPVDSVPNVRVRYLSSSHRFASRAFGALTGAIRAIAIDPGFSFAVFRQLLGHAPSRDWRKLLKLLVFAGERPDLVHFEWITKAVEIKEVLDLLPCPTIASCRGTDVRIMAATDPQIAAGISDVFAKVDRVHCVSADVLKVACALGLNEKKAFINRPAVDTAFFAPPAIRPEPSVPRLITVGRLHWVKGLEYALVAVRRLLDAGLNLRFDLIGPADPSGSGAVQLAIRDLSLNHVVELHGALPPAGVRDKLARADLYVSSSLSEGISNAVLEAMSMELPVVSTDVGGMNELVREGVDGRLVPPRDPVALADAIRDLIRRPDQRRAMGQIGRRHVIDAFDSGLQVDRFVTVYEELQRTGRAGAGGKEVARAIAE